MSRNSKHKQALRNRRPHQIELLEPRYVFSVAPIGMPLDVHGGLDDGPLFGAFGDPPPEAQNNQSLTNFLWQPMVFAGLDAAVSAGTTLQLNGEVLANQTTNLTIEWRVVSGPGNASFSDRQSVNSTVQFDQAGSYQLELLATNNGISVVDHVFVNVTASNIINIDQAWLDNIANQGTVDGATVYILREANKTYTLQMDVTTEGNGFYVANRDIVFDLNGHTITYNTGNGSGAANRGDNTYGLHGVILYRSSGANAEIGIIPGAADAWRAVIRNGSIVNAHAGNLSHGIYGLFAFDSVIEHMEITTDGKDSHAVYLRWADDPRHTGTATIRDSVLTSHTSSTFNRHSGPANVFVGGRLIAERNILIGGNSGFNTGNQSVINNNIIGHSGFATNGYGVFAYDTHNVTITNNLILPTNGRGIIFDGGHDNTASGNIILHLEAPNSEFGDALNPPAIRMRYGAHDHTYSNNISLGIGGSGYTSASSIYLTTYGHGVNTFENNDATTILVGAPDRNHYAQPVTLEGQGTITNSVGPGLDVIANNNFQSNHHMVALSGFDGGAQQREPLANNSWEWTTGESAHTNFLATVHTRLANLGLTATVTAAAESHVSSIDALVNGLIAQQDLQSSRAFWRLNHWTGGVPIFGDLLDSTFGVGVDPRSHDGDPINGSRVLARSGFTRNVQFLDGVAPIANAAVTVTTAEGDSYQTTTDANGFATLRFYDFGIEKVSGGSNNPYTTIDRSQSTITAEGNSIIVDHNSVPNQINFGTVPAALAVPDDQGAIAWIQSNWNQTNTTLTSVSSAASESLYLSYARYASGDTDPNLTHSLAFAQMPLSKPQEISSAILRKEELDEPDKEIRKVDAVFDLLQEIDAIQLTIRRIVW